MRAGLLLPGIALAAFAATLGVLGWPPHDSGHEAGSATQVPIAAPAAAAPVAIPGTPAVAATAPTRARRVMAPSAPAAPAAAAVETLQPALPDPAALPSYENDQRARSDDALRSPRTR
jgi:hypothetical protein